MPSPPLTVTQKQPLETLFNDMYHGKRSFADFALVKVMDNVRRQTTSRAGKARKLLIPNDKLKGCHDFIRLFLLDYLPINDQVVFSYRKGVNAYDAVKEHVHSKFFFVCDIADFFPNLGRARIMSTLVTAGEGCPIADINHWLERIVDLVCVDDTLPIGFSTSPSISNAALRPFDNSLQSQCNDRELIFTRYSDDIIVSGANRAALEGIEDIVATCLHDATNGELKLHPGKSKFLHGGIKIKLLGMVLLPNGAITVDASVKEEIEILIHFYLYDKSKLTDRVGGILKTAEARLAGLINYVNTVDQSYLDKLRRKFGSTVVDYFLHRSFA